MVHTTSWLTNDKSWWLWVYFPKKKSQAFKTFQDWLTMVEKQINQKLYTLHTDGGEEYCLRVFKAFLIKQGIVHQMTASQTPEQNRVAKWQNWSIFDCICMILINSGFISKRQIGLTRLGAIWATCQVWSSQLFWALDVPDTPGILSRKKVFYYIFYVNAVVLPKKWI